MSILLSDKNTERAVTLLALMATATNPVERERYKKRLWDIRREHPELRAIGDDDPRIEAKVQELREAFEQPKPVEACYKCGHLASHRRDYGDGRGMLPVCGAHLNPIKPPKRVRRPFTDLGDAGEYHARRDR